MGHQQATVCDTYRIRRLTGLQLVTLSSFKKEDVTLESKNVCVRTEEEGTSSRPPCAELSLTTLDHSLSRNQVLDTRPTAPARCPGQT